MEGYKTIKKPASAELEVKKSRFIANAFPCETETQATLFISSMKKKYWDAKHNVSAFSLKVNGLRRYSDDGEPHSTAGLPVLESIIHSEKENVVVVVTRYFGGILLGTGGLVRAYSEAARLALEAAETALFLPVLCFEINCDYSDYDLLNKFLIAEGVKIISSDFESFVSVKAAIPKSRFEIFSKKLENTFCARIKATVTSEKFMRF